MMIYEIFEGNMERLEKKLNLIQSKCQKYGCEFNANIVGEVFKDVRDEETGRVNTLRFIQVEASGVAKVEGWEFVATVEHNTPTNIIRSFRPEYSVPEKYYTAAPVCEHCNSKRNRKDTYIIRNTETGGFKQVGKSCLKDFTNGLSAEAVAQYISWFNELIKGEAPIGGFTPYYSVFEVIQLAVEAVNLYGYQKSYDSYADEYQSYRQSTKEVIFDMLAGGRFSNRHLEKGFDVDREGNKEKTQDILGFVGSLSSAEYGYISNLKTLCSKEYCQRRDIGIIASAVACYNREMEYQEKREKAQKAAAKSSWVGTVGERITLTKVKVNLLTSWDTMYGYTYLYQFTDPEDNIYTWKTGKVINCDKVSLKGTVKAHSEYKGTKQTELTRCTFI